MAKTIHAIHGHASDRIKRTPARTHELPADLLTLQDKLYRRLHYMQTGETYHFTYTGKSSGTNLANILENQKPIQTIPIKSGEIFSYTPPHDPRLDRLGHHAFKEMTLLVQESTPEADFAVTHTLVLHRSIYGHLKPGAGLALLAATILVTTLAIVFKRRRVHI